MSNDSHSDSISRVFDLLPYLRKHHNQAVLFGYRRAYGEVTLSTEAYIRMSDQMSNALLSLGLRPKDHVVSLTPNRPELNVADMGIMQIGAVHVPLTPGIHNDRLHAILSETKCKLVFYSGTKILQQLQSLQKILPGLQHLISLDPTDETVTFQQMLRDGEKQSGSHDLEAFKEAVKPSDPATVIYISGSSTEVKGVILSHKSQVSNFLSYALLSHIPEIKTVVSLLPLAHSFERTINYCQQYFGLSIWYIEKIPGMIRDFKAIKPEVLVMVPLLLSRLFSTFEQHTLHSKSLPKSMIRKGLAIARKLEPGKRPAISALLPFMLMKWFIFPKWRKEFGNRLQFILCGGAALQPQLLNLSFAAGIPIYEGYGITEAGPLISYNHQSQYKSYTVGKPMPNVQVKISENGEVLVKSDGLMTGYLNPKQHSAVDQAGWLHTGDLGIIDDQGFLKLTGIRKEIFKLSSGVYVHPGSIEARLSESRAFRHLWIYGHNQDELIAIVSPNQKQGYKEQNLPVILHLRHEADPAHASLFGEITEVFKQYNSESRHSEQIHRLVVCPEFWSQENGLLKKDGNLNRIALYEKYSDIISKAYSAH